MLKGTYMNGIIDIISARLQWELGGLIYDLVVGLPILLIILGIYGFIYWINRR